MEETLQLKTEIAALLNVSQFHLQKWTSNDPSILNNIPSSDREDYSLDISLDPGIKTIGLFWHPASDSFGIKITAPPIINSATKREVLSSTAKVFDPLSWLAPVTIRPKILLQKIWKTKIGWDDPLPSSLIKKWHN